MKKHIVITGTGRTGTSFLIQLFTRLGLDTGFSEKDLKFDPISRAGLEHDMRSTANLPYIVKDPAFCNYAPQILVRHDIEIELVVIPMRDIYQAAQSRREVWKVNRANSTDPSKPLHGGGLMNAGDPALQELALAFAIYRLLLDLSAYQIPVLLLSFHRMMKEPNYLWEKLNGNILKERNLQQLTGVYNGLIKHDWVHDYKDVARGSLSDNWMK